MDERIRELASRYDEDRETGRLINADVDTRSRLFNIGLESTFGHPQDDVPFDEIRAICGPFNCSQVILAEYHEALGLTLAEAERLGNVLGGGMWHGGTCGSLMAAILAAGYLDCPEAQPDLIARFAAETGAVSCPTIVHSPTSCATCIAVGRELVAEVIAVAAARSLPSVQQAEEELSLNPRVQPAFAVSRYEGDERAIILPDGVTEILPHAFEGLEKLRIVLLSPSLRTIGDYAFAGCSDLRLVVIQDGLEAIGAHAFDGCAELTAIDLPSTVSSIGRNAFAGCAKLKKGNLGEFGYEDEEP